MQRVKSFRDLDAWNVAMELAVMCYRISGSFPGSERFCLVAQIRRAAASIPANIAEGHNPRSPRVYRNHVRIALGSHAEVDTLIELSARLDFLSAKDHHDLEVCLNRTGQILSGLLRSLKERANEPSL